MRYNIGVFTDYEVSFVQPVYTFVILFLLLAWIKNKSPAEFKSFAYLSVAFYLLLSSFAAVYLMRNFHLHGFLFSGFIFLIMRIYDASKNYNACMNVNKILGISVNSVFLTQIFSPTLFFCGPAVMRKDFKIVHGSLRNEHFAKSTNYIFIGLVKWLLILPFLERNFETSLLLPLHFNVNAFRNIFTTGLYRYAQFYLSFSALSDLSYGFSGLMGIKTKHNFFRPYLACSLSEFWNRWNRTAVEWMDAYLFRNKFSSSGKKVWILMLLPAAAGLMYGISPAFFFWGLMHGLGLVFENSYFSEAGSLNKNNFAMIFLRYIITQIFIIVSWTVFFWGQ